jgi:hypothetical protein
VCGCFARAITLPPLAALPLARVTHNAATTTQQHPSPQHEGDRGHAVNLLRVAAEPTVDVGVRHMAAIAFKNAAKRRWDPSDGAQLTALDEADKAAVRYAVVGALIRCACACVREGGGLVVEGLLEEACDWSANACNS